MIIAILITISLCFLVFRFRLDVLNNETLESRQIEHFRIYEEVRDMPGVLTIAVDQIYFDKDYLYIKSDPIRETYYFRGQNKGYYGATINEVFDIKLSVDKRFTPCKIGLYRDVKTFGGKVYMAFINFDDVCYCSYTLNEYPSVRILFVNFNDIKARPLK